MYIFTVGRPIDIPKLEEPTREQIEEYHGIFLKALIELFEEQKHNYLDKPEDKQLIIL